LDILIPDQAFYPPVLDKIASLTSEISAKKNSCLIDQAGVFK